MSLYQDYRPETLNEMEGNESTIKTLESVLSKSKKETPHAFLLTGDSGCGKTTLARIIRTELGCSDHNYKEIDSADFRGIDTIREIRRHMKLKGLGGGIKVWLLDEAHMIGTGGDSSKNVAQNALLKALEDTPPHVYLILATTNPEQLLKTIRNRCTSFSVSPLSEKKMEIFLGEVCEAEEKKVPEEVIKQISRDSFGSPRAALVILDKIIDLKKKDMAEAAEEIAINENEAVELFRLLLKKNVKWKEIAALIKNIKIEPESLRRKGLFYFEAVLLNSGQSIAAALIEEFAEPLYSTGRPGLTLACYNIIKP